MKLALFLIFVSVIAVQSVSISEKGALLDLYGDTGGPNWIHTWNLSADPCTLWYGITCSVSGSVTAVILDSNRLDGTLPPSISNLTSLVSLSLSNNVLSGVIPSTIGANGTLPSLVSMDLSGNLFSGAIPSSIFQLPNIKYLSLKSNSLSGNLPANMGSSVNALYLSNNQLTGSLAPIETLTSLKQLYLDSNQFTVMINTTFPLLLNLQLSNNPELHPIIPNNLSTVSPSLQTIGLSNTGMSGTITPGLGGLLSLTVLDMSANSLSGTIPLSLSTDTDLQFLNISFNDLTGSIPNFLGSLPGLITLDLSHNSLNGSVPAFLSSPPSFNVTVQCNSFCTPLPSWCALSECSTCSFTASPCVSVNSTATTTGHTTTTTGGVTPPPGATTTSGRASGSSPTTSTTSNVHSAGSTLASSPALALASVLMVVVFVAQL